MIVGSSAQSDWAVRPDWLISWSAASKGPYQRVEGGPCETNERAAKEVPEVFPAHGRSNT